MPFKKGQSGNPGGRPKEVAEVRELAKEHGPEAIERLVKLMASDNERTAVAACEAILNRGYGKPGQSVTIGADSENPLPTEIVVNVVRPQDRD